MVGEAGGVFRAFWCHGNSFLVLRGHRRARGEEGWMEGWMDGWVGESKLPAI